MVATKSNWQNITVIIFLSLHPFVICLKVTEISLKHRLCFTGIHQVKINVELVPHKSSGRKSSFNVCVQEMVAFINTPHGDLLPQV